MLTLSYKDIISDKAPVKKAKQKYRLSEQLAGCSLVAPAVILLSVFTIYPIVYLIYSSLFDGKLISKKRYFVGLENYKTLLSDAEFIQVVDNTVIYSVALVALTMILAVLVAVWLNSKDTPQLNSLAQAAIFTPHIISLVSASFIFIWMMDPQNGLLNVIITWFGFKRFPFLSRPETALFSLVLVMVWKGVGYYSLLILSALQSIPPDIYEAAELDNAPKVKVFLKITLPMISPTVFFTAIVATINAFQVFDTVSLMTQGGPVNSTNTLVYYIYQYAFRYMKLGEAMAAGVVLLVFVLVLTVIYFVFLGKKVHYQ